MLVRSGTRGHRRRSTKKFERDSSTESAKVVVDTYQRLAALVLDTTSRSARCINELVSLQQRLVDGVQEFLGFDTSVIDEPALAIVMECSRVFQELAGSLDGGKALQRVSEGISEILAELEHLGILLGEWGEAAGEYEHYEQKVAELQRSISIPFSDKLDRNRDKLNQATSKMAAKEEIGAAELKHFSEKRSVIVRGSLIAYLRVYLQMVSKFGDCAHVAEQCAAELHPGTRSEIVALRKARELNGRVVTIDSVEPDQKRCRVVLDGTGEQKSVKIEHLMPASEVPPPEQGAEDAEEEVREEPTWCEDPSGEVLSEAPRISFGHYLNGLNIELFRAPGGGEEGLNWLPVIAARPGERILHGVCFTAAPLQPLPSEPGVLPRHYFEVMIMEAVHGGTTKTLSIGFAWPPAKPETNSAEEAFAPLDRVCALASPQERPAQCEELSADDDESLELTRDKSLRRSVSSHEEEVSTGRGLPELARDLPYAFVVGGDLTRAHLGGEDLGKVSGWRPLKDATKGSYIGCLLEQDEDLWRLSIYQQGERRCKVEAPPPAWAHGPPHGVLDIAGAVSRVQLRQGTSVLQQANQV